MMMGLDDGKRELLVGGDGVTEELAAGAIQPIMENKAEAISSCAW